MHVTITLTEEQAVAVSGALADASRRSRRLAANARASVARCDECGKYSGFAHTRQKMHERNERLAREAFEILSYARCGLDVIDRNRNSSTRCTDTHSQGDQQ